MTRSTQLSYMVGMNHSPGPEAVRRFIDFLNTSPTLFHVVHDTLRILENRVALFRLVKLSPYVEDIDLLMIDRFTRLTTGNHLYNQGANAISRVCTHHILYDTS